MGLKPRLNQVSLIYELGPTKWFVGFTTEEEVLKTDYNGIEEDTNEFIKEYIETAKYMVEKGTTWNGEGTVYISGLPGRNRYTFPELFITIKPNDEEILLCSPRELPYLQEFFWKIVTL